MGNFHGAKRNVPRLDPASAAGGAVSERSPLRPRPAAVAVGRVARLRLPALSRALLPAVLGRRAVARPRAKLNQMDILKLPPNLFFGDARTLTPCPQVTLHWLYWPHSDHPPSTGQRCPLSHRTTSRSDPAQSAPPYLGPGLVQLRSLKCYQG